MPKIFYNLFIGLLHPVTSSSCHPLIDFNSLWCDNIETGETGRLGGVEKTRRKDWERYEYN